MSGDEGAPTADQPITPLNLPGGRAALCLAGGRMIRIGWPEFGPPMFYPMRVLAVESHRVRVAHDLGADGEQIEEIDTQYRWTMDPAIRQVQPYLMYGQSLALSIGHDRALTDAPTAPGRALTFANPGAGAQMSVSERPGRDQRDFGPCHFPQSDLDQMEDLKEGPGESPVSAAVAGMLAGLPADTGVVATNHARGGVAVRKLLPRRISGSSGIQYAGILRALVRTREFCDVHGCTMRQPIVSFIHGEAFQPDDWRLYGERLVSLQAAMTEDFSRITESADPVAMFVDQARAAFLPDERLNGKAIPAAVAQLRAALTNTGHIFCVGPKYFLPRRSTVKGRGDPVHLVAAASRLLGDYHGRAIHQTLCGRGWLPLHVSEYSRVGQRIVLTVAGGDGSALAVDTETVARTVNSTLGFRWMQDGGTGRKVVDVSVDGRQILVELDADPGRAGVEFRRAVLAIGLVADMPLRDEGPLTGGRTNVRDRAVDIGSGGEPMFNWLCHDWIWETEDGSAT